MEDYILIYLVYNFYLNTFRDTTIKDENSILFEQTKQLNLHLKNTYEFIFNKLKMNDLSLLILKKELKENNSLYKLECLQNFVNIKKSLTKFNVKLTSILESLPAKAIKLKLNL